MVPCSKSTEVDVVKKSQGTLGLSGWTALHRSVTKKTVSRDGNIIIMIDYDCDMPAAHIHHYRGQNTVNTVVLERWT